MSATPKNSFKSVGRKPRAPRRGRRAAGSSEEEDHSSDSDLSVSDSDTLSSEDALTTPAPPDHSVSPPSKRRSKKKATEPLIPEQPTSWSELVSQEDDIHQEPPIIDFADFVSGPGPSAPVRGRPKARGGKTQRQAYLERLSEDPSFIPRVGQFWGHDERLLAPELRGMSDWWRGRWNSRGRGRGRGMGRARPERPVEEAEPAPAPPTERTWGHDGFEKMKDQERDRSQRGRGRGRGRGGRGGFVSREPEQLWTKAPDTHLHVDPSTRPQFPGQGRGIKVNLPGQWRPSIVRIGRNPKPAPARPAPTSVAEVPTEIVVKLPGKQAQVVAVSRSNAPANPTVPEEPETVQPLDDVPPTPTARLPGTTAPKPAPEFIPRPAPTSALPAQVLEQPGASAKPAQVHGRTRSQLDAVAFARPSLAPTVPLAFGSLDPTPAPPAPAPAPPRPDTNNAAPPQDTNNPPLNMRPPMPPMASFTPPPNGYYNHNPYAFNPLDGATYYPTATPGYYPPNGFFMPPRRAPVSIRAPGESEERQVPAWNYYPQPQHGHNPYYSPSGTPYPPQPGYYQGGEYPGVYDYNGVYY